MLNIQVLGSPHPFAANCYLVSAGKQSFVVDPNAPYQDGLVDGEVKYILLTHAHFDHILEVDSWRQSGAEVIILTDETAALSDPMRNCFKLYNGTDNGYFGPYRAVCDGESLEFGDSYIKVMATPGHTSGCATYIIGDVAFVGDTVFEGGGFGRYDLPTGNFVMLRESIRRICSLPDKTILYPGHGGPTTVAEYKQDLIIR